MPSPALRRCAHRRAGLLVEPRGGTIDFARAARRHGETGIAHASSETLSLVLIARTGEDGRATMEAAVHGAHDESALSADDVQRFWVYKRGQLVLVLTSAAGPFVPTTGIPIDGDPTGLMTHVDYASGQFMSLEWEPRIRMILRRAEDLVDLIERLEDRKYEVDLEPPSQRSRPFRWL